MGREAGGTGGAHVEHPAHARDAGGVEAQPLVERPRVLEHVLHVRDAGGVEAQRLVERRRLLQRVKRRAYGVGRGAGYWEAGGGGRPRCTYSVQARARLQIGSRAHGEERT